MPDEEVLEHARSRFLMISATRAFLAVAEYCPVKLDRKGGWLGYMKGIGRFQNCPLMRIGSIINDKSSAYAGYAAEKVVRLSEHSDHESSRDSRDEALEHWAGAFRFGEHLLSFSGLSEDQDEAVVIATAVLVGWLSTDQANALAMRNDNSSWLMIASTIEGYLHETAT